ncbi:hypothetical protein MASR1M45_13430 [Candidatus Kapaibacterium sp.]
MKRCLFLTVVALVLLFTSAFNMKAQVGFNELDPNILWVADSTIGRIDGFAVHPNGNIFAYQGNNISEINGNDGKLIRKFTVPSQYNNVESIDITYDGKYLVTSFDGVIVTELESGISKTVGMGGRVSFVPNTHKVSYRGIGGSKGHDSSIVILDLETSERTYIKTEELIHKIAFSPDGRFFATGGFLYTGGSIPTYSYLKLWDAHNNKLIKELKSMENSGLTTAKIEFSPDSKLVAFFGDYNLRIFDTESYNQVKHYDYEISSFTFISPEYLGINSKLISIFRLSDDKRTDIFEFSQYFGRWLLTNTSKNILYSGTGYPDKGEVLIAFDLNKVFSTVGYKSDIITVQAEYQKGNLSITGIRSVGNQVKIQIIDMNGKIIINMNLANVSSEFSIPVNLNSGTYIIHLKDGSKEYSYKFLVVE